MEVSKSSALSAPDSVYTPLEIFGKLLYEKLIRCRKKVKDGSGKCLGKIVKERESRGRVACRVSSSGQFLTSALLRDKEDFMVKDISKIDFVGAFVVFTLP